MGILEEEQSKEVLEDIICCVYIRSAVTVFEYDACVDFSHNSRAGFAGRKVSGEKRNSRENNITVSSPTLVFMSFEPADSVGDKS